MSIEFILDGKKVIANNGETILEVAKKNFGFSSNKLDALAGYFGIEHKLGTDFKLWKDARNGDEDSGHLGAGCTGL